MQKKMVAFGELLWDILPAGKVLGGAPANFIYRVNTYGDEGILLSRVGNDPLGAEARSVIAGAGIKADYIQRDLTFPTGTVDVAIDSAGNADFHINRDVAYDHIEITAEMLQAVREADCIYFGSLIQRYGISKNTLKELVKEAPRPVKFCDINLRKACYTKQSVTDSLHMADILKINEEELLTVKALLGLPGDDFKKLAFRLTQKFGLKIVLVTLGRNGAFYVTDQKLFQYEPGYKIDPVDTVGSGDAFSAGFIHSFLHGKSLKEALLFANAAGAMIATTRGATHPVEKFEIEQLSAGSPERNYISQLSNGDKKET